MGRMVGLRETPIDEQDCLIRDLNTIRYCRDTELIGSHYSAPEPPKPPETLRTLRYLSAEPAARGADDDASTSSSRRATDFLLASTAMLQDITMP